MTTDSSVIEKRKGSHRDGWTPLSLLIIPLSMSGNLATAADRPTMGARPHSVRPVMDVLLDRGRSQPGAIEEAAAPMMFAMVGELETKASDGSGAGGGRDSASETTPNTSESGRSSFNKRTKDMEEIIVTAQKREERLQDVPISISVLGGADLDSSTVQGVTEALNQVPGVSTTTGGTATGAFVTVRGVSTSNASFSGSNPVAYYVDSVPFGLVRTPIAPDSNAYDMERVEVLRGPQGTLYGANAQSGVVRVLTKDADVDNLELKGRVSGSRTEDGDDSYRGDMAVNVPIISGKLAARAVLGYQESGGWIDKLNRKDANGSDTKNMRLKVNANPTNHLSVGLSAWVTRIDSSNVKPWSDDEGRYPSLVDEPGSTDYDAYGLKVGYDFSGFSVASTTSYLDYASAGSVDINPLVNFTFPALLLTKIDAEVFSQEILLNSSSGAPLRWSLGAFYRDATDRFLQVLGQFAPGGWENGSESYATFGEIGQRIFNQKFGWTAGLRYFHDEVSLDEYIPVPGQDLQHVKRDFKSTTPRVVLNWYPNSELTVYASYAEGFRSGFAQAPGLLRAYPNFYPVEPDELRSYELGSKANFFDGHVSIDAAVYFQDWRDAQVQLLVPSPDIGGVSVSANVNALSASGMGMEFAATSHLSENLTLGLSFGWNDLTLDEDLLNGGALLYRKGDRLDVSPEYTGGVFAEYRFPLGGGGLEGNISASANYRSKMNVRQLSGTTLDIGVGDDLLIARVAFSLKPLDHWEATIFVDNITNDYGTVVPAPTAELHFVDSHERPRTIGLQIDYRY